jgi:hypothetical protein
LRIGFIVFVIATDLRSKQVAFYPSQRLPKETATANRRFQFRKTPPAFHPRTTKRFSVAAMCVSNQVVRPLKLIAETQPNSIRLC